MDLRKAQKKGNWSFYLTGRWYLSLILTILLVLSLTPAVAFAGDEVIAMGANVTEQVATPSASTSSPDSESSAASDAATVFFDLGIADTYVAPIASAEFDQGSEYGTLYPPSPATITVSGQEYRFDGWYTESTFMNLVTPTTRVAEQDYITLYARWLEVQGPMPPIPPGTAGWYYFETLSKWVYVVDNSAVSNAWRLIDGAWYHFDADGFMQTGTYQDADGLYYFLASSGVMQTGWQKHADGYRFHNAPKGEHKTGWHSEYYWYYLSEENGLMANTAVYPIGQFTFSFKSSGAMQTGWVHKDGIWYFHNPNGAALSGWQRIGSYWYYFADNPAVSPLVAGIMMVNNKQLIGTKTFFFKDTGQMIVGWAEDGTDWYYTDANGYILKAGWKWIGSFWYYLSPIDGKMASGKLILDSGIFILKPGGQMGVGWAKLGGDWYYTNASGYVQTGWFKDGSYWYYLSEVSDPEKRGKMAVGDDVLAPDPGNPDHSNFDDKGRWLGHVL